MKSGRLLGGPCALATVLVVSRTSSADSGRWLHPAELAYLDFPPSLMENVNCNGAMWGINAQHYDSMMKISRPVRSLTRLPPILSRTLAPSLLHL